VASVAGLLGIPAFLAAVVLLGDVSDDVQMASGYAGVVAAHFFEHTLDYLFITSATVGLTAWCRPVRR
jgi:hypothetical protein